MVVKGCERNARQQETGWNQHNELDPGQTKLYPAWAPQQQLSLSFTASDLSFIPLDGPDSSPDLDCVVPVRKVAVSEILPLTLVGNQVSLAAAPTNSALPLSPIFIKTNGLNNNNNNTVTAEDKSINICEYYNGNPAGLLENLEEITSLPNEFLNIGELYLGLELSSAGSDLNSFHLSPI